MTFQATHTVAVREFVDGDVDDMGVPAEGWTTWVNHQVYGWGAPTSSEPKTAGHDRELVDIELLVPPNFPSLSHRAQVRLYGGDIFDVIGSVERYDHSPFGWDPGGVVNLKRVIGG